VVVVKILWTGGRNALPSLIGPTTIGGRVARRERGTIVSPAADRHPSSGRDMRTILVVSTESHTGKSVLCLAIGRHLRERGISFGYMKPISYEVSYSTGEPIDRDAEAIRGILGLQDSLHDLAPVPLEGPFLREAIQSGDRGFRRRIEDAYRRTMSDRDVALIEGRHYLGLGVSAGLSDLDLAQLLDADVVLITRYEGEPAIDRILCAMRLLDDGPAPLGVVLTDVSMETQFGTLTDVFVPFLAERGAEVLGIVPADQRFQVVTVQTVVDELSGQVLTNVPLNLDIRYCVVATMGPEEARQRFRRTPELAVVASGDRDEIHQLALEVPSLRCLILTGHRRPRRDVIDQANARGVPVILVGQNPVATAALCERLIHRPWIRRGERLEQQISFFCSNVDIERLIEKARPT